MQRATKFSTYIKIFLGITLTLIGINAVTMEFVDTSARINFVVRSVISIVGQIPLLYICVQSVYNIKRFIGYGLGYVLFMFTSWQISGHLNGITAIIALLSFSALCWWCLLPVCRRIEGEGYGYRRES